MNARSSLSLCIERERGGTARDTFVGLQVKNLLIYSLVTKTGIGFLVLDAVATKNSVFWEITPRSPVKVNRRF
jgi:hypothetical protein